MSIYIAFAQVDLCLVRLVADIVANAFTLSMYLVSLYGTPLGPPFGPSTV